MAAAGFVRGGSFLGLDASPETASWVLFGVPMDFTASFQAGSRFGPEEVRSASQGLETFSWASGRDLAEVAVADLGDLELPIGNVEKSLDRIRRAATALAAGGRRWCALGGEHLITLPLVEAALEHWPDLVVVHWDAHADLRDQYLGERLSHATVMRRVYERLGSGRLYQFGVRSGDREEREFIRLGGVRHFPDAVYEPLLAVRGELEGRPIYLSIDLDVLDPAYFPGTGTPEPGGITPQEAFRSLWLMEGLEVVGLDLVEAMPRTDLSRRTALLAAKMVREGLLALAGGGRRGPERG